MPRWLKIILLAIGVLLVVVATLPWWLGVALRPAARSYGADFARYETVGYGRFRLTGVRIEQPGLQVTAGRIEAPGPLTWFFRRNSPAAVTDLKVTASRTSTAGTSSTSRIDGFPALHRTIQQIARPLRRWLPRATLDRGEIAWPGQSLTLPKMDWSDGKLTATKVNWREYTGDLAADVTAPGKIRATFKDASAVLDGTLIWTETEAKLTGSLWSQSFSARGHFPGANWWPLDAEVTAENWKLPANLLKLGPDYAEASGSTHLSWRTDHFELRTMATATPKPDVAALPFEIQAEARGDQKSITVTKFNLNSPFATATLSAPLQFIFAADLPSGPARLKVDADLAKQPWIKNLSGKLRGTAAVDARSRIEFSAELEGVRLDDFSMQSAIAEGALAWPRLELARLEARLNDRSQIKFAGTVDLTTKELSQVTLLAELNSASVARWLPATTKWSNATVSAQLSGPLAAVSHSGTIELTQVQTAPIKPVDLKATWSGRAQTFENVTVEASAGRSTLFLAGSADSSHVALRELRFIPSDGVVWQLSAPAQVIWSPRWQIENLQLQSTTGRLLANLSGERRNPAVKIEANNVGSDLITEWLELRGPAWLVRRLALDARLDGDVVAFDAQLAGSIVLQPSPADIVLRAHGDRDGVRLEQLRLVEGERTVAEAAGVLPVTWQPAKATAWVVDDDDPFEFRAHVEPDASSWAMLADFAGITLDAPTADIRLNGTLSQPKGELTASAKRLAVAGNRFKGSLPEISDLSLSVHAVRGKLTVETLSVKIEGQPVSARGRLPLGGDRWRELLREPAAFAWRAGEGRIEITEMDLAPLARRFPRFMAAQGKLSVYADLREGSHLTGELKLLNAATRPLPALGVVQEINAELALTDRTLQIQSWSARLGGEPVVLKGTITLPPDDPVQLALSLTGKNLPLVRQAGLLVRTDLDLHADTDKSNVTRVTGAVNIRDCIVMADLAALLPTGPRTATQQPPYFAVEASPYSQWPLSVDVRGRRAVRINTAFLRAVASPNFHLGGTLGEPRAVGEVTADEGRIFFPFATFAVQYGAIRLSEADPYHPQLTLNAISRYHDYQLRLEGNGPLDAPNLTFSSTPSLEASEVLMMVTSGAVPENDPAARTGAQRLTRLGTYLGQGILQGTTGDANRLEIASGERASRQGRETYQFTYRLDDRWSLVGEYDEYDEYNAGLKWRAYTQEGDAKKKK